MADDAVIKLLEEIRDLQKIHLESYKDAVRNQQEAIELQKRAARRQKVSLLLFGSLLLVFLGFIAWSSYFAK